MIRERRDLSQLPSSAVGSLSTVARALMEFSRQIALNPSVHRVQSEKGLSRKWKNEAIR